jgi:AmmeMemoRadiSam system protein A
MKVAFMLNPVAGRASYNYRLFMNATDKHIARRSRTFPHKGNFWIRFILGAVAVSLIWFFIDRPDSVELTLEEQAQLLTLAREQLIASVAGKDFIDVHEHDISDRTLQMDAAFVSLTVDGALRGCMIDQFEPHEPLFTNVLHNVQLAVGSDARFPAIRQEEIDDVRIQVSIVYDITTLTFGNPDNLLERIHPNQDGVILEIDGEIAAYLPSVWQIFPDPADFLTHLCIKAGWDSDRWRREPYLTIRTFQVYEFGEPN